MSKSTETENPAAKPIEKANSVADHLKGNDNHALSELHQDLQGMKAQDRQQFFHTLANDATSANGLPGLEITNNNNQLKVKETGSGAVLYDESKPNNGQATEKPDAAAPAKPDAAAPAKPDAAAPARPDAAAPARPDAAAPARPDAAAPTDANSAAPAAQPEQELTPKLRAGEGPYQALHRQHPEWNDHQLKDQAHKILAQTGRHSFKQGEQFKMNSDGSVTSHLDNRSKDGSYTETTSKDGKPVSDKVHMTKPNGYTDVERSATGAKQTDHTDDGQGGYKEHSESTDGTVSDTTYDAATKKTHTESTDKDKNKTVRDTNGDGTYSETTTDGSGKVTRTESLDKDHNRTIKQTDAAGTEHEETTNLATGVYTETTKDKEGHKSDKTQTPTADGFTEVEHKDGKTINTSHTDTGNGNYTEHSESSDGSASTTSYDKASAKTHTVMTDKDGNTTTTDKSDDGVSSAVTTDIHGRTTSTENIDKDNNDTVRNINADGTYNEVTKNADQKETRSESVDAKHNKTVKETDPTTGAYKEDITDGSGKPVSGSRQEADGTKSSWKINADKSMTCTGEANGHKAETTFVDGHLTKSVDTDTKTGVVTSAVHKDGQVTTTVHTPGQANDVVSTAPEVVTAT